MCTPAGCRKRKRDRDMNWSPVEKQFLWNFAAQHKDVLDDRGNDSKMIIKKNNAWKTIMVNMQAAGFYRSSNKLKQQWRRMKLDFKKSITAPNEQPYSVGHMVETRLSVKGTENVEKRSSNLNHRPMYYSSSDDDSASDYGNKLNSNGERPKRYRSANWSLPEKQLLLQHIQLHRDVLDDKRNDAAVQEKKREAWNTIQKNMTAAGYPREIPKCKEQWVRMKFQKGSQAALFNQFSFGESNGWMLGNENVIDVKPDVNELNAHMAAGKFPNSNQEVDDENGSCSKSVSNGNDPNESFADDNTANMDVADINVSSNFKRNIFSNIQTKLMDVKAGDYRRARDNCDFGDDSIPANQNQTEDEMSRELHRYRIAVEKKRLKLLDMQMRQEQMIFQKDFEIKVLKLEIMKKYGECP